TPRISRARSVPETGPSCAARKRTARSRTWRDASEAGTWRRRRGTLRASRGARALDGDAGVVVRDSAGRLGDTGGEGPVDFGPVPLERSLRDLVDEDPATEGSCGAAEHHGIVLAQAEPLGVRRRHEDVVAVRAGERVVVALDHRVELLAAA